MGFYGNITNANKTQFTFDKIYPNRREMEKRISADEIYLGRYVLIEYDINPRDAYRQCYVKEVNSNLQFYSSIGLEEKTRIKWVATNDANDKNAVITDEIIYSAEDDRNPNSVLTFYICTGKDQQDYATFRRLSTAESPYTNNYQIDMETYGAGRGYDSTVWQKVYTQGTSKYVMIAELNSVVPTFDLSVDAPTMDPLVPHFDIDSTNVYYKLHLQPTWGFRVAKADGEYSDETTVWTHSTYDPATDSIKRTTETVNAAINFNKPGFNEYERNVQAGENNISVEPTGSSGKEIYNAHDGTADLKTAPDIQELRINLPAIGNMMSDAWDIIHGPNRDDARTDENGSLQGRLDSFKDMAADEIPVKRGTDGTILGATINGGKTAANNYNGLEDDKWIQTQVNGNDQTITIHHTFNPVVNTSTSADKNDSNAGTASSINKGQGDTLKLYTPIVDDMGHVVGKNTETVTLPYGYKTITTNGRGSSVEINTDDNVKTDNVIADNTQDSLAINSGNKWVRIDSDATNDSLTIAHDIHSIDVTDAADTDLNDGTNTITVQDITHDAAGHVVGNKSHTYTLPYGYKTIVPGASSTAVKEIESNTESIVADETQDTLTIAPGNKWIRVAGDEDNDTLTVAHEVHEIDRDDKTDTSLDGVGTLTLQDLLFDAAGHVIADQKHKYILPNAIRNIDVAGSDAISEGTTAAGKVEADSYNDTLTLNAQNRWINLKVEDDTISIGHAKAGNEATTAGDTSASTPDFGATFNVPYVKYDEMGHISNSGIRTVKIPQGKLIDIASTTNTANVLTSIDFTPSTGEIVTGHKNVGTLELTNYSTVKTDDTTYVQSTDSINTAFNKVDTRIDSVNTSLTKKINDLDYTDTASTDQIIYSVSQTDGKITIERKAVGELIISGYTKPTSISAGVSASDSINTAIGKLDYSLEKEINRAEKAESDLSAKIDKAITDLDVNAITTDEYSVIDSVSETDGKINATTKYLSNIKLQGYSTGTNTAEVTANDTVNVAFGKLQAQINAADEAVKALTNGTSTEEIDSVMELVKWTEEHGETTQGIINAIGQKAEGENSSTGIYSLIDAEVVARTLADENITKRIDNLPATNITAEQITKWEKAEENIQADWNQADANADDFIKNKPTDLVKTSDIANMAVKSDLADMVVKSDIANMATKSDLTDMAVKSDLTDMVVKSDIANMIETTTSFVYTPEEKDETTGEITVPAESMTIAQLIEKIKTLETRIVELEAKHAEDSNEEEIPTE